MNKKTNAKLLILSLVLSAMIPLSSASVAHADGETATVSSSEAPPTYSNLLYMAVENNNPEELKKMLSRFDNPTAELNKKLDRYGTGDTILHLAIYKGRFEMVKYILENYDVDLNLKNNDEKTPLDVVRDKRNTEIINGINLTKKEFYDWLSSECVLSPPHYICSTAQFMRMEQMIINISKIRDITHRNRHWYDDDWSKMLEYITPDTVNIMINGRPLLDYAKDYGSDKLIIHLLNVGATYPQGIPVDPSYLQITLERNRPDLFVKLIKPEDIRSNPEALVLAAKHANPGLIKFLLQKGATPIGEDYYGCTPLIAAARARSKSFEITKLLINHGANADINAQNLGGDTALHVALWYDNSHETVKLLIENGIDVNIANDKGVTPLQLASCLGNSETITLLLDKGADVNARDYSDQTVLHRAAWSNNPDILQLLINHCTDINTKDNHGDTPLHNAVRWGKPENVRILINNGADVNARNNDEKTPLNDAAYRGKPEIADILINSGADINAKDNCGYTPLHHAACKGNLEIAAMLIKKGADVNAKDNCGYTPLHYAVCRGGVEIASTLINNGADVNAQNNCGITPINIAEYRNYQHIIQLMTKTDTHKTCNE